VNVHRDPKRETIRMAFTSMLPTRDMVRAEQLGDGVVVSLMFIRRVLKETPRKSENFKGEIYRREV
jgi:hypothetical protein